MNVLKTMAAAGLLACLVPASAPAWAQQAYLEPPATMDANGRCDFFSRLHRFTIESKSTCDDGRQVKPGPVTSQILAQCRTMQGAAYDRQPVTDMMNQFLQQVNQQGLGNACRSVKQQAWDLIEQ